MKPFTNHHDVVLIVGSGPSIENYEPIDGVTTIAVNNALMRVRDRADYWFTLDPSMTNRALMEYHQFKRCQYVAAVPEAYGYPWSEIASHRKPRLAHVHHLDRVQGFGLATNPRQIHTGNSAFGALGLAFHMRPKLIVLIGVDGTRQAKFDGLMCAGSLDHLPDLFQSAVPQLIGEGIQVVNANPSSMVGCFKKMNFSDIKYCIENRDPV